MLLNFKNPAYKQDRIDEIMSTITDSRNFTEELELGLASHRSDEENLNLLLQLDAGIRASILAQDMDALANFVPKQDSLLSECSAFEAKYPLEYNYFQSTFTKANGQLYFKHDAYSTAVEYFAKAEKYADKMLDCCENYAGSDKRETLGFLQWADLEILEASLLAYFMDGSIDEAYRILKKWTQMMNEAENNLDIDHKSQIPDLYELAAGYAVDLGDPFLAAKWIEIAILTLTIYRSRTPSTMFTAKELFFRTEKLCSDLLRNGRADTNQITELMDELDAFLKNSTHEEMELDIVMTAKGGLNIYLLQALANPKTANMALDLAVEAQQNLSKAKDSLKKWMDQRRGTVGEYVFYHRLLFRAEQRLVAAYECQGDLNLIMENPEAAVKAFDQCMYLLEQNENPACNADNERVVTTFNSKLCTAHVSAGHAEDAEYYSRKCLDSCEKILEKGYDELMHGCRIQTCFSIASILVYSRMKKEARWYCEAAIESLNALKQHNSTSKILQLEQPLMQVYKKSKSWF